MQPDNLHKVLEKGQTKNGITITIGSGNSGRLKDELALVSANIDVPGDKGATLSLVGPARMDYDKVVATLQYFAKALDAYFQQGSGEDEEWNKPKKDETTLKKTTKRKAKTK